MAHPPFWPSTFFYPVGNTSPVCLTSYLPPGERANVLLLGTGDLRNIFYTTYIDGTTRTLDFTACDIEPATLARNVLLLTLLFDGRHEDAATSLWNFYYHFLVDDATLSLIISQCSKLIELSKDIETWNSCKYAVFIRLCSQHTLAELRRMWSLYAETENWSNAKRTSFKETFLRNMRQVGKKKTVATAMRSAGPLATDAFQIAVLAHREFWKRGVTTADAAPTATNVNPTFAFAAHGDGCVSHYGTYPLPAFHLAPAFMRASGKTTKPTLSDIYTVAQSQFRAWCDAFSTSLKKHKVTLRLVLGDALAVCHTISHIAVSGEVTAHHTISQWRTQPLTFDGGDYTADHRTAPIAFDLIDSSNLADHLGLLNLLVATTTLLRPSPFSAIQTETLLLYGKDPTMSFAERICGDIRTMSLLLDLAPVSFVSGLTAQSNVHELIQRANVVGKQSQYHERVIWKKASLAGSLDNIRVGLALDVDQTANLLWAAYRKMFSHESPLSMFQDLHLQKLQDLSVVHYSRLSFASLIGCVRRNVTCDWEAAIQRVLLLVREDFDITLGNCYYQDLLCQLRIMGLCVDDPLRSLSSVSPGTTTLGALQTWSSVPFVGIVFTVPRQKYSILDEDKIAQLGTPNLKAEIVAGRLLSSFCSVRLAFGSVSSQGTGEERRVTITEDPLGKRGGSDVVVAFIVPSALLTAAPEDTQVHLCVQSTPINSEEYVTRLGQMISLHSERLDSEAVHVVDIPRDGHQATFDFVSTPFAYSAREASSAPPPIPNHPIRAELGGKNESIVRLVNREELSDEAKLELAKPDTEVTHKQVHPCMVQVNIGARVVHNRRFPYPVVGAEVKMRIARKSGWIELTAPLAGDGDLPTNRYPLCGTESTSAPWNINRLVLERLPAAAASDDLSWIESHLPLMFSNAEMATCKDRPQIMNARTKVKQTTLSMFQEIAGLGYKRERFSVFGLHEASGGGIGTLGTVFFVSDVRLDLPSHTVVVDAHVLPLDAGKARMLALALTRLENVVGMPCSDDELAEWARLIPTFVERCRDWTHKTDCAYLRTGVAPLSDKFRETPICDCGKGKVSPAFRARKEWAAFIPYVTRIAISPIFAVSYLEPVGQLQELETVVREEIKAYSPAQPQCLHCGRNVPQDKPIMRCGRCRKATYCDKTCQTSHWRTHKNICATR